MNTLKPLLDFFLSKGGASAITTHALARDKTGAACGPSTAAATQWCLLGAFGTVFLLYGPEHRELEKRVGSCSISSWNDTAGREWEKVQELLSRDDV